MYFDSSEDRNSTRRNINDILGANNFFNSNKLDVNRLTNSNNQINGNINSSFDVLDSPLAIQNINIENVRVKAANDLKKIELQLKKSLN